MAARWICVSPTLATSRKPLVALIASTRVGRPPLGRVSSVSRTSPLARSAFSRCVTVARDRPEAASSSARETALPVAIREKIPPAPSSVGLS
ncbi:hypothetical protein, partial [Sinorhizobium medicae]|uniref:hypothetical protein n=1 Tax=Sinorhizobium medicae TaxID=110321 RepID=UPI002B1BD981